MPRTFVATTLTALVALIAIPALAQDAPSPDQEPGARFEIRADALPEPYAEPSGRSQTRTVDRGDAIPLAPDGFSVSLFAEDLLAPRHLLAIDGDNVLVSLQRSGQVIMLSDTDGDGAADAEETLITGMTQPYGLARIPEGPLAGDVLLADTRGIWHMPLQTGGETVIRLTEQGALGGASGHSTRSLVIHPETLDLYVGVGSAGNIGVEPEPRATIQVFAFDGSNQRTFATGLRNPTGIGFHPETGKLWSMVQERDGMGDRLVPDYFTEIDEGDFFGWPYAYTGGFEQPQLAEHAPPGLIETTRLPSVLFQAHSSAMDFVFVPDSWPEEWRGDAIAALRGSWNRNEPTGYKLVRVLFEDGEPTGAYENFVTGFWVAGERQAEIWGRPSNLDLMPDGSLLVADDTGGTIWRISPPAD